jgi:hypothetical protein
MVSEFAQLNLQRGGDSRMPDIPSQDECRDALSVMIDFYGVSQIKDMLNDVIRMRRIEQWIADGMTPEEANEYWKELND